MWCGVVRGCWAEWGCTGLGAGCGVFTSTACSCCAAARISAAGAGPPKRRAHLCLCVPSPLRTQVYLCQWRAIPVAVKVLLSAGVRPGPSADQAVLTVRQPVAQKLEEVRPGASQTPHAGWSAASGGACARMLSSLPPLRRLPACRPGASGPQPTDRVCLCPQEAGLLATLRHPNIVQFLGVCPMPPCLVTEYAAAAACFASASAAAAMCLAPRRGGPRPSRILDLHSFHMPSIPLTVRAILLFDTQVLPQWLHV